MQRLLLTPTSRCLAQLHTLSCTIFTATRTPITARSATAHLPADSPHYSHYFRPIKSHMSTTPVTRSTSTASTMEQQQRNRVGTIVLTDLESRICDLLVQVAEHLHQINPAKPRVTIRIAGGWVRDKLLGKESEDLDFALDNMMGYEFAMGVNQFMREKGLETSHIGKIDVNPDRSKHLETATTKVLGHHVDFVNLRTETYHEHSRIPVVEFGSPEEDALRRDITINALFYNLHTRKVEDYTQRGLEDLEKGYIRTPLPPVQTFIDDPLRVLRVIRFASRFHFTLDSELHRACIRGSTEHETIRNAFLTKISRERVGTELDKMLRGNDPYRAIQLIIKDFGFYDVLFKEPPPEVLISPASGPRGTPIDAFSEVESDGDLALRMATTLAHLLSSDHSTLQSIFPHTMFPLSNDDIRLLFFVTLLVPFRGRTYLEKKKNVYPLSKYMVMTSLKLSNIDSDFSSSILTLAPQIISFIEKLSALPSPSSPSSRFTPDRRTLGLFTRELGTKPPYPTGKPLGSKWPLAVLLSFVIEVSSVLARSPHRFAVPLFENGELQATIQKYQKLKNVIADYGVEEAYALKPVLHGGEVAKLRGIKPGPVVATYLTQIIEWQLENPTGTKEECEEWLKSLP
ncbi:hypothetical protein HDV05_003247 [Chytridiales sp. JEL 0842]|nr:hypothetical protein HDV05_003247 [Chytridiales sp. JEL 0842]